MLTDSNLKLTFIEDYETRQMIINDIAEKGEIQYAKVLGLRGCLIINWILTGSTTWAERFIAHNAIEAKIHSIYIDLRKGYNSLLRNLEKIDVKAFVREEIYLCLVAYREKQMFKDTDNIEASFFGYLNKILFGRVIDALMQYSGVNGEKLKKKLITNISNSSIEEDGKDVYLTIEKNELHREVIKFLNTMSMIDRELIYYRFFEGYKYKSLESILGMGSSALKKRNERALKKLRMNGIPLSVFLQDAV